MPNTSEHLAKVRHNKEMLKFLGEPQKTPFPEWFVTVTFYIAVHCLEALFYDQNNDHAKSHAEREDKLRKKYPSLDVDFKRAYFRLQEQSRQARYMQDKKFKLDKDDCEDASKNLEIIESECKESFFPDYPNV